MIDMGAAAPMKDTKKAMAVPAIIDDIESTAEVTMTMWQSQ
jgi:hypothetical protein